MRTGIPSKKQAARVEPSGAKRVQRRLEPSIRKRTDRKKRPWLLDLPAQLSETGSRQRLHFAKKTEAERELDKRLRDKEAYGDQSEQIHPGLSAEAKEAAELLKPFGVSLLGAVKAHLATLEQARESITLDEAFRRFLASREDLSPTYRRTIEKLQRKLPKACMGKMVSDLTRRNVSAVLGEVSPTSSQFNSDLARLRSVLSEAQKDGFCAVNPAADIRTRKTEEKRPHALTVKQSRAVLDACKDHRGTEGAPYPVDCRDALPAIAVQLFAGVRPAEVTRMTWENIDFERGHVAVPPGAAKTSDWRYIEMEPALRAWLDPWRKADDEPLCPSNWERKRKQVRHAAKIAEHADCLRHTFASMWLSAFGDMGGLLERMGHTTQRTTLKHYRRAVIKSDALEFWQIAPEGVEIKLTGVAA
jgi:integrase/recombinase XerD